jgi:hypothetical protein
MGSVKRVLLGSAAGIFAVAGAQAADLPVKAKPVEYVKVCSLYGAGFWYVPGTDTCIKIGAFVQAQVGWNMSGNGLPLGYASGSGEDTSGLGTRTDSSNLGFRNRNAVSFDLRTQTEYGTLRSYLDIGTQLNVQNTAAGAAFNNASFASSLYASRAFIQFAGFTAGRYRSFFDMFNISTYNYIYGQTSGETSANGIFGLAYTWQFGGGLSATVALEDGGASSGGRGRLTSDLDSTPFRLATALITDNKGQATLDPVLNVRLDQAWGFVGVSAALHDASGGYFGSANSTLNGHPDDKFGFAGSISALFNNPFGLAGDSVGFQAAWTRGAAGYATTALGTKTVYGSGNSLGFSFLTDGVFRGGNLNDIELTDVWSITGAYEHVWNPKWKTSVYGGFVGVSYTDAAKGSICGPGNPFNFTGANCDPDSSWSIVGTRTQWNPVPDLLVGLDLTWHHLNTANAGAVTLPAVGARPAGAYTAEDQDTFGAMFRVQRNFLY